MNGDEQVAYKSLSAFERRLAAIDGFQMSLQLPTIGALDGSSRDNQVLKSDSNGAFAFETLASPVGVFARTKDGRAAGLIVLTDQLKPGKFALRRTLDFVGQLAMTANES